MRSGPPTFPGLVLAAGIGFSPALGAFGMAIAFTGALWGLARRRGTAYDSLTALVLVGCLAAGVILASDVYHSGSNVEQLLFGSLLLVDDADIRLAAVATVAVLIVDGAARPPLARHGLRRGRRPDPGRLTAGSTVVLLALIALTTTAALTRDRRPAGRRDLRRPGGDRAPLRQPDALLADRSALLAAAEGTVGLWLSVKTNAPPGATIATLSGAVFALAAIVRGDRPGPA